MNEPDPKLKAKRIVEAALDRKAELPVVLDMRELTAYADTFIILSGRSDRQVRSIAESIVHELKSSGEPPLGVEGLDDGHWVLIDCNDAIVHVFDPETREQYDLERLWRDAPRLDLDLSLETTDETSGEKRNVDPQSAAIASNQEENDAADPAA